MAIKTLKQNGLISEIPKFSEEVVAEIEEIKKNNGNIYDFKMYSKIWYIFSGLLLIIQILQ